MTEGLDLPALEAFFAEHVPGFTGGLSAELVAGGRSNLTYLLTDGGSRWILRRPPLGGLTPSAHDMGREYRVVAALAGSGVPVPRVVAYGDTGFSVVEYVAGTVIRTQEQLSPLSDEDVTGCANALVEVLARLHDVDPATVGLADFGRPTGFLSRQVRRWHDQWQRVHTRSMSDVDRLHAHLAEHCPPESDASIVHGDYRIDNAILDPEDPTKIRAVVDWEMATLGDPLADLGLHLAYRDPAFAPVLGNAASTSDRMPTTPDLARHYEKASGRDLTELPFYLGLGYYKAAVIAEGIHARYVEGHTVGTGFNTVGGTVAPLAAAGLRALTR